MISTNVMSFVKKIMKSSEPEPGGSSGSIHTLKQTLTSGLQEMSFGRASTSTNKSRKTVTSRLTPQERLILRNVWKKNDEIEEEPRKASLPRPMEPIIHTSPARENCRICRKHISENEQSRECDECGQHVCEDCASYSSGCTDNSQEWKCSFCRRQESQGRVAIELPPGSGMNRVPSVRRMAQRRAKKDEYPLSLDVGCESDTLLTTDESGYHIPCNSIRKDVPLLGVTTREFQGSMACRNSESRNKRRSKSHVMENRYRREGSFGKGECKTTVRRWGFIEISKSPKDQGCSLVSSRDPSRSSSPMKPSQESYHLWETSSSSSADEALKKRADKDEDGSHLVLLSDCVPLSASESSLDDRARHEELDQRGKERMKRRSKVHRDKCYLDDPDSDPTSYREKHFQKSKRRNSSESSSDTESFQKDLNCVSKRRYNLKVPHSAEKSLRQIASESALNVRKGGSVSSDVSDNSVNEKVCSDQSLYCGIPEIYPCDGRLAVQEDFKHKPDVGFSLSGTGDSSISPEDHSHYSTDKSCSVDEVDQFAGAHMRRSIPSVLIDSVVDHQRSASVSLLTSGHYIVGTSYPRRNNIKPELTVPENQLGLYPCSHGKTRSTHSLDLPREETGWTERRASAPEGENIRIVIDDVDSNRSAVKNETCGHHEVKLLTLNRDPKFPGDRILKWNGVSLVDKSYEEVSAVIQQTKEMVEILVEKVAWKTLSDQLGSFSTPEMKDNGSEETVRAISPTRRKLPKTPVMHVSPSQREIRVQICFDQNQSNLAVTLLSARGLRRRRSTSGSLPRAYAKLRLVPPSGFETVKTHVAEPGENPEWNELFIYPSISAKEVVHKALEITVWDVSPSGKKIFNGETRISLRQTDLRDSPVWYVLNYHQVTSHRRRKTRDVPEHYQAQRKQSRKHKTSTSHSFDGCLNGTDSLLKSSSMDCSFLHPSSASYQTQLPDDNRNMRSPYDDSKQNYSTRKSSGLHAQDDTSNAPKRSPRVKSASFRIHRSSDIDGEREESAEPGIIDKTTKKNLTRTLSLKTNRTKKLVGLASVCVVMLTLCGSFSLVHWVDGYFTHRELREMKGSRRNIR
ncbi:uncharacterized protein LOC143241759 [Tachypleus tridentatus]|uniref:uncharacterized protein LOC143241759 n=1 Tax=Tachypleus tridentatus TaxID=6853 RepID=UPI003FD1847A